MGPGPVSNSMPLNPCLAQAPLWSYCVTLGRPRPMHSFSNVREKLLQTKYIIQSVVCAMMWQLASTHGSPIFWPYQRYGWSSAYLNCLVHSNICDIPIYPNGRLVEQVALLNSSVLLTTWLGHSIKAHNVCITNYEAKIPSIDVKINQKATQSCHCWRSNC